MSDTITGTVEAQPDTAALAAEESRIWDEMDAAEVASGDERNPESGGADDGQDNPETDDIETASNPAPATGGASDAQPAASAPGGTQQQEQTDPWASAPAEYRTLYEETVGTLNKRLAGQDRTIRQLNARLLATLNGTSATGPGGKPGTAGGTAKDGGQPGKTSLDDDPDLKKLTEDFPEVAAPIRKVLEASQANVREVQQQLGAMQAGEREAILSDNEASVLERHSDFIQVATSPEFKAWTDGLSPSLKAILAENARRIVDPQGAIAIVDLFKQQHAATAGARPGAATAQPGSGTGPNISGRRARQAESSSAGHHGGGPRVVTEPPANMTEAEAWDFYERQEAAQQRRAG